MVFRWFSNGLVAALLMIGCAPAPDEGGPEVSIQPLADELAAWTAAGAVENYDSESIFAYIDGHAEVFLAYGMQRCVSRRYQGPEGGGELVVDLFEMPSSADAFGVYSHDRNGEEVDVGQGAIFRLGWLSFWKGPWYGSIYAVDAVSRETVIELAAAVADGLPVVGAPPDLPRRLPPVGLEPQSVCYLRSPQILNAHTWVGPDNPFDLGPETEAAVGKYALDGGTAHVVVVRYPAGDAAVRAEERLKASGASTADGPVVTVGRRGEMIAAVVGEIGEDEADDLLELALGGE